MGGGKGRDGERGREGGSEEGTYMRKLRREEFNLENNARRTEETRKVGGARRNEIIGKEKRKAERRGDNGKRYVVMMISDPFRQAAREGKTGRHENAGREGRGGKVGVGR